jgi:hypothetical protein
LCSIGSERFRIIADCFGVTFEMNKKLKLSHYRPRQALRIPGVWDSQSLRQLAHEGGKFVSPTHKPHLAPRKYSWYSVLLEADSIPGPYCGQTDYVNEKF